MDLDRHVPRESPVHRFDTRLKLILDVTAIGTRLKEQLQTIPGVAEVRIWGEKRYAMRIWIDPGKLAGYGLTVLDVRNALNAENVELPSGRIEGQATELTVRTMGLLRTPEDFNNLIVRAQGGNVVRFAPPLIVTRAEIDEALGIMDTVLAEG